MSDSGLRVPIHLTCTNLIPNINTLLLLHQQILSQPYPLPPKTAESHSYISQMFLFVFFELDFLP